MPKKTAKSKAAKPNDKLTVQEQKNLVLGVYLDFLENDAWMGSEILSSTLT